MTKRTKWLERQAKSQISLGIRQSEQSSLRYLRAAKDPMLFLYVSQECKLTWRLLPSTIQWMATRPMGTILTSTSSIINPCSTSMFVTTHQYHMVGFKHFCSFVLVAIAFEPHHEKTGFMLYHHNSHQWPWDQGHRLLRQSFFSTFLLWKQLRQIGGWTSVSLVLWVMKWRSAWPIFHGPLILPYILKTI